MTILTVQFDIRGYNDYKKLLQVFESSVRKHMPEANFESIILEGEDRTDNMRCGRHANTRKLAVWADYIDNTDDDVILADCDMLMLRSAEHAFDIPFDIAYTRRIVVKNTPFNNGIMMIRPNERSREFMHRWLEVNNAMFLDEAFHAEWNRKYKGMNQTAFGYMLETGNHNADLHAYTTRQWNAVDPDWPYIDDETVFLHIKGALRQACLNGKAPLGSLVYPATLWYVAAGYGVPYKYKRFIDIRNRYGGTSAITKKHLRRHKEILDKIEPLLEHRVEK